MYCTTGFFKENIVDLCVMICAGDKGEKRPWPPILGLYKSVVIALTYMRRNRIQAELAETFVPTADDLDEKTQYIIDGRSSTAACSRAGHGPRSRNSTLASTRPPD
jgi:hypothetical protein